MSSEKFQAAHDSICHTGTRLLNYLEEIRKGRFSEGDDTKSLQSIEDDINKALSALKEQKYQVAVIAAMKAGKSTFLNAVIGADVLASESAACTICRTDVRHIPDGQVPRLLEYREGQRQGFVIAEGNAGEIQQKFLVRTREIREKGNPDNTIRFEIEHPIEAISALSSLSGFTLVDTPGPNEWESAKFNTVALKQTALEALRTCNAILFVLNYASYKDNAISDLFKDVIENRKEILAENTGKIYFILNKVDQKTEQDKDIADVIEDLKRELTNFGFSNPIIYPASSRQGLLAKLIQQGKATESQIKDFKKFFSARYATEDEEGNQIIPAPRKIAPQALKDSGILTIEQTVIQTITQNSGWNLLSDVVAKIDKAGKGIEDTLNTQISGWQMGIDALKQKVEEYRKRSDYSKSKVEAVKKSVDEQKQILISGFSQAISQFAEGAKAKIEEEIDLIAESVPNKQIPKETQKKAEILIRNVDIPSSEVKFGFSLPSWIPLIGGTAFTFETKTPLVEALTKVFPTSLSNHNSNEYKSLDPYKIRLNTKEEAKKFERTINEFCAPHIKTWWLDTQDKLVRDGTRIREELVHKIKDDIQQISNELSNYLGEALEVELNVNPIQFPSFDFPGIDTQVQYQQQLYKTKEKQNYSTGEKRRSCEDEQDYTKRTTKEREVEVEKQRSFYEVNLRETVKAIKVNIDSQASGSRELLQRVIEKQVAEDFRNAEKQINDYIKRFQDDFDRLLKERETKEVEGDRIREMLEIQKAQLNQYLHELTTIKASLHSWKPMQTIN
ncbi:dynamin family protein [Scytonema hofmannii FACHB-248]|uniref:Dynamin family protein n=1 Tax=Scytonema hofmannii FACHB-248 TaxID=1842502 RepID=A0ABR8GWI2_9CYAN|nr:MULTISPECIES: dynamin family protein [Nostocales]MBD2607552.1 dynamin family protein [Scytonema hofmannii FACHB-248]